MKLFVLTGCMVYMLQTAFAQPQVGKPMPEFALDNVTHYSSTKATLNDFKGKWLFLDFWFTGCTNAIRHLPKMSQLQQRFKDKVQFMMVGINSGQYKKIEEVYGVLREKYNLQLASAYDSALHVKWDIWSMPNIIMIDPEGIVRHITTGQDMTEEKLQDLFEGKDVVFQSGSNTDRPEYDASKFPGSPDSTLVFRSILTRWKGERGAGIDLPMFVQWDERSRRDGIRLTGYTLENLYKLAYTGVSNFNIEALPDGSLFYPKAVVECENREPFLYDSTFTTHKGFYNYNLALPVSKSSNVEVIKNCLQSELRNAFGYEATLEDRTFQVWQISAPKKDVIKLASKGGPEEIDITPVGIRLRNVPVQTFYNLLVYQVSNLDRRFIEKNETGFEGNIDMELNAVLTDAEDVKRELKKLGFDIVLTTRKLKALVIRDPKK